MIKLKLGTHKEVIEAHLCVKLLEFDENVWNYDQFFV